MALEIKKDMSSNWTSFSLPDETKKQILLSFVDELTCHSCQGVPEPSGKLRLRYKCVKNGHTLCPNCVESKAQERTCPSCESLVCSKPCSMTEKVIKDLPWFCSHRPNGCKEILEEVTFEGLIHFDYFTAV